MKFEELLRSVGDNESYQKGLLYYFIAPTSFILPWFMMANVFMVSIPDHWCNFSVPDGWNVSKETWKELTIPR